MGLITPVTTSDWPGHFYRSKDLCIFVMLLQIWHGTSRVNHFKGNWSELGSGIVGL